MPTKENKIMNSYYPKSIPIKLGAKVNFTKTIDKKDILAYAQISGDTNPLHLDHVYAKTSRFKKPIAHGMLTASFISALIGTKFPRLIYLSQNLKFCKPVYIGDTITATATVIAKKEGKEIFTLQTICTNQDNIVVIDGTAVVMSDS